MVDIKEYIDVAGVNRFSMWFDKLDTQAAAKITTALVRIEQGNLSNVRSVGLGVHEYKVDFGPGYRIYFGRDGDRLIILLAGGTKRRQEKDIRDAQRLWKEYRSRKKGSKENADT